MKDIDQRAADVTTRSEPDYAGWEVPSHLNADLFDLLYTAAMHADKSTCVGVAERARQSGVAVEQIADDYIPAIAHQIGKHWCEDNVNFAQVTIGTARLQAMLRDLGPEWCADQTADADAPLMLLLSTRNAHHTLGIILLAGQLRRRGYSVRMILDPSNEELTHALQSVAFDAIFISASEHESLVNLREMVKFLRTQTVRPLPIAIGGGLLRVEKDIAPIIGVDIATSNIDEAVEHCGLAITQKTGARRADRI